MSAYNEIEGFLVQLARSAPPADKERAEKWLAYFRSLPLVTFLSNMYLAPYPAAFAYQENATFSKSDLDRLLPKDLE